MRKRLTYALFALLIANTLAAQELPVSGTCTVSMLKSWKAVHDSAQAAVASDVQTAEIGSPAARRLGLLVNWRPLLPRRQVMCAKVFTRKPNAFEEPNLNPFNSGNDWDFYFIPQPHFDDIFEDALALMPDKSGVWSCQNGAGPQQGGQPANCMEAEVWPEGSLEAWLQSAAFNAALPNGSLACAYGPLVTDYAHGGRPEVHPLEVFWWQSSITGGWTFVQVQDSSRRFDERFDFTGNPFPQDWEPWSTPRFDEMRVAIELQLHQPTPLSLDVDQDPSLAENVNPAEDPHPGQQHVYTYQGTGALVVNEGPHQIANTISTRDFCRDDSQQRLIGYLALRAEVGNQNGFGYQVTYVTKHGAPNPPALSAPPAGPTFELVPQSVQVKQTPEGLQIHGDVQLKMAKRAGAPEVRALFKQIGKTTSLGAASPAESKSESTYFLKNLDLLKLDELQLPDSTFPRAGRALYPIVQVSEPKSAAEESQQPTQLLSAFLGVPTPSEVVLKPERLESQALSLTPRYVLLTKDGVEPEDGTPIHDLLNQNLDFMMQSTRPNAKLRLDPPQFQGFDCGTAEHIDCSHGTPVNVVQVTPSNAHPDIRVVYTPTDANPANVQIYWPSFTTDHLYKLKVTVHYSGPNADQSIPYVAEYWSIDIPVKDTSPAQIEAVVTAVAQFAGLDPTLLALPPFDDSDPLFTVNNSRYRRSQMLRMAVAMFSADSNSLAPDQVKVLVDAARTLASANSQ